MNSEYNIKEQFKKSEIILRIIIDIIKKIKQIK